MQVMDLAEKVAERLTDRVRKRTVKEAPDDGNPYDVVRARRAFRGIP